MEHFIGSSMHVWIGWCLSEVMEADGPFPSVVTYGSAVAALRRGGHWQHALQLLERAQDQKVGAFWEIEVLTVLAFPFPSTHETLGKAKLGFLDGYFAATYWGVYIAGWMKVWWYWMLHVDAQWGQITKLSAISDHTLDGQKCGWPVYLQIFPTGARFLPSTISNHVI